MMLTQSKLRYGARLAETQADVSAAQSLRHRAFANANAPRDQGGLDQDRFDAICKHVLVEDTRDGRLVCCFRILPLKRGDDIGQSYAAQFYDLSALHQYNGPLVELGRFCIDPAICDPDILRVAWGALTRFVDAEGVELLIGCTSFSGTLPAPYEDAFALLKEHHLAPDRWVPQVKAPHIHRFADLVGHRPDTHRALSQMPTLLRSYLAMGGWVSDHAVIDHDLNTLHVFTGLEIGTIPDTRKRLLRAVAG